MAEFQQTLYCHAATATNAVVTREIKFFQNDFRDLLQLWNIFQHVQCR